MESVPAESTSFLDGLLDFFDNPYWGVACAFLIPTVIIGYSLYSMRISPNVAGLLDHLLFVLLFYLIFNLLLELPSDPGRVVASFLFVFGVSLLFLSNSLYFKFFHAWGQLDTAKQWKNVPSLWQGLLTLPGSFDYVAHFLVPLFLWQFTLRSYVRLTRWTTLGLAALIVVVLVGHMELASFRSTYMDSNPLFYMMREKSVEMSLTDPRRSPVKVDRALSRYQLRNPTLYEAPQNDAYPFQKMPAEKIPALPFALKSKPNVVLVLMESMRAFEMGAYGAKVSFTPNLDKIAKESVLFKKYYALGTQTIRGEFALHASYNPNVLGGPVYVNNPDLSVLTLPMVLKKRGYKTHWIEANCGFINQKVNFLSKHGIDECHTSVPITRPVLGLGAADEDTFDYSVDLLSKQKKPFFAEIMTLSNHWTFTQPFPTIPETPKAHGNQDYVNYTRGIYYADHAVGKFIEKVRKSRLADDTIFIFTGDHGIWYFPDAVAPENEIWKKEIYFRGPFLIWSPKLLKPRTIDKLSSQLDMAPTVLDLLDFHDENSFMGTSLFRGDVPSRYVFPIQDGRWNMRWENEYVYDVGPEIFASLPPFNLARYMKEVRGKPMDFATFSCDADFLQKWNPDAIRPSGEKRSKELKQFALDALNAYQAVIFQNRVYKSK